VSPLLVAENLTRVYRTKHGLFDKPRDLRAVGGISFTIDAGRTLAVVGESGCGKSTLARLVTMIERPNTGALAIAGIDSRDRAAADELRRSVQLVFQNPYGSLNPRKTVGAILEEPLIINTRLDKSARRKRVADMMARVGLAPEHARRYPHMFSGGQRQRIAIARALMLAPKLVVADEPVSALDVSIQAQVLNLLIDLQRQFGLAYLFISHDLAVVRFIAHDVLVMYLGLAVEYGDKEPIFERPLHPYTQALLAASPAAGKAWRGYQAIKGEIPSPLDMPGGCVFVTRCPYATARCWQERPALRSVGGRSIACHYAEQFLAAPAGAAAATPA
jgi:dipeptide transport system ATP-binding protein